MKTSYDVKMEVFHKIFEILRHFEDFNEFKTRLDDYHRCEQMLHRIGEDECPDLGH